MYHRCSSTFSRRSKSCCDISADNWSSFVEDCRRSSSSSSRIHRVSCSAKFRQAISPARVVRSVIRLHVLFTCCRSPCKCFCSSSCRRVHVRQLSYDTGRLSVRYVRLPFVNFVCSADRQLRRPRTQLLVVACRRGRLL